MAPLEILASVHDGFVHLLTVLVRRTPEVVLRAIARAYGALPSGIVRERHPSFEIAGLVRRAHRRTVDLLITIHDPDDDEVLLVLVIEVQDCPDPQKRRIWPQVAATAAVEFRADAEVVVFAISESVRRWLRRLIPKMSSPVVEVGPGHVEVVVELDQARARPLETIFSGLIHADADESIEDRVSGIRATLVALLHLDASEQERYSALVSLVVPKPLIDQAKRELGDAGALSAEEAAWAEEIMSFIRGNWAYGLGAEEGAEAGREEGLAQGRRRGLAEGRRQGVDEGRRRELRRALLDVLALRGVDPSPAGRAAIETCEDLGRLEQWYEQAKSAPANMLAARFE